MTQTITLGQPSTVNAPLTLLSISRRTTGLVTEADSALTATRRKNRGLGLPTTATTAQKTVVRPIPGAAHQLVHARSWPFFDPSATAYTGDLDTLFSDASDSTSAVLPHLGTTGNAYPDSSIVTDIGQPIPEVAFKSAYAIKVVARVRFKTGTAVNMRMAMELAQDGIDDSTETNEASVPYTSLSAKIEDRLSVGSIPTSTGTWGQTECYLTVSPTYIVNAEEFLDSLASTPGQLAVWWDTDDAGAPAAAFEIECSELSLYVLSRTGNTGTPSEADSIPPLIHTRHATRTVTEVDEALSITVQRPLSGTFAGRDDISRETGLIPIPNLVLANLEAGEYAPGLLATLWFEWTAGNIVPTEVRFGFDWAGQSGGGGAAVRVYDGTLDTIPGSGDVLASDTGSGAAGAVDAVLTSPTPNQRYYVQLGLEEKAGTTTYLELAPTYADPNSFTPVIPSL